MWKEFLEAQTEMKHSVEFYRSQTWQIRLLIKNFVEFVDGVHWCQN